MFKAFNAFVITLFTALNNLAMAIGHLSKTAEEAAQSYSDEARVNRQVQLAELNKQLKLTTSTKA